jgi:phosphate transport system substrate-binding protein
MFNLKNTTFAVVAALALTTAANASDRTQIKIVGSSTVYPFSSAVAEEFGAVNEDGFPTPVVESTGSGGGAKLFCEKGDNSPDITNASRPMKAKEYKKCKDNGIVDITEAVIGYDGIAFANSKQGKPLSLTKKQLALAVAKEVPSKDGKKLIPNPCTTWNCIDPKLPNQKIEVYGPPKSSGTRDAFEEMVLQGTFKKMPVYTDLYKADKKKNKKYKKYSEIRTDGVYVESGENDNLIVQKLDKNPNAFGIFGYSFLMENEDKIQGAKVNDKLPTPETIADGSYPIARSLYFYIKKDREKGKLGKAIKGYVDMFMSEDMIGNEGILTEIGLIPLADGARKKVQERVENRVDITKESDASKKFK